MDKAMTKADRKTANEVLAKIYSILLKIRLLREWTRIHKPVRGERYSERQIFTLELIHGVPHIKRRDLGIIFHLSPSAVTETVKPLVDNGLAEEAPRGPDGRERPLVLTSEGESFLSGIKQSEGEQFVYLFEAIEPGDWKALGLIKLLQKIDDRAREHVNREVLGPEAGHV